MREEWGKLAPAVQAEIHRRERELVRQLQETADARRQHESMTKMTAPYQHILAIEGSDPMKAFGDYLRTAAILRSGSVTEKAQAIANVTRQFGVDIRALDAALAGMPMQPGQQQPGYQQQQFQDPRLDKLLSQIEESRRAQQEQLSASMQSTVEEFVADTRHEFIEDVREDMADMLEVAANRGRKMSMQEAYDRACAMNPEIVKILAQRAAAQQSQPPGAAPGAVVAAKQRAAASHPGGAGGPGTANGSKPPTVREALEAAFAQHEQR